MDAENLAESLPAQNKLAKQGAWLFRWRSYLPLLLTAIILPSFCHIRYPFGSHTYDLAWEMFCFTVSLFGFGIRCYTAGHVPRGTSGRNTKKQVAEVLNTTGIYSVVRNPLYLGNFFMILGVTMFTRTIWVPVIYALAFWAYYGRIIAAEEAFLLSRFGKQFEEYRARVPAFVPNFALWRPNALPFSLRTVLKREYSSFFALVSAFTALEIIEDWVVEKRLAFDPVWVTIFFAGLVIYITLRTLKKKTRLLDVPGR